MKATTAATWVIIMYVIVWRFVRLVLPKLDWF